AGANVILPDGISGQFHILVFTDSNFTIDRFDAPPMGRVEEFRDEGNNISATPLTVLLANPPDLQITDISVPEKATSGQSFYLTYTVTNVGAGNTPPRQAQWDDLIYLSRDPHLDLQSDRFLGFERHTGGLVAGGSYEVTKTLHLPRDLTGPFYV